MVICPCVRAILTHMLAFVIVRGAVRWFDFVTFRGLDYLIDWRVFNAAVTSALASDGLRVRLGQGAPTL